MNNALHFRMKNQKTFTALIILFGRDICLIACGMNNTPFGQPLELFPAYPKHYPAPPTTQ
jgi:hypothetical protein